MDRGSGVCIYGTYLLLFSVFSLDSYSYSNQILYLMWVRNANSPKYSLYIKELVFLKCLLKLHVL